MIRTFAATNPTIMETLARRFCERYHLPFDEGLCLLKQMEPISYKKGSCLVREGERNTSFYLVAEGIWRGHYLRNGDDISLWFASPGEVIFSTWGYVASSQSLITIEAMSESKVYRISKDRLEAFFNSSAAHARTGRSIFEHQFMEMETWLIHGGASQAKERYLTLLEQNPELLRYVPLKYIASYLYITPQSLSRIRAELARGK